MVGRVLIIATLLDFVGVAAEAAEGDFEQLLALADGHAVEGRPAEALDAYEEALAAMPRELRVTDVGELVVLAAGKAALEDYRARGELESLERGRAMLVAFIADVSADPDAAPSSLDAATARLEEIEAVIPEPEPEPEAGRDAVALPHPASA